MRFVVTVACPLACLMLLALASPAFGRDRSGSHEASSRGRSGGKGTQSAQELYWGAWIGSQFTGLDPPWDMSAVSKFQQLAGGKGLSLIEFSSAFEDCLTGPCTPFLFPTSAFNAVRRYGAIPIFSWGSNAQPIAPYASQFSLKNIIAGQFDSYIRTWAEAAAKWGHPFFLRFDWEMNGGWFPWGWSANGNQPGQFVKAWRHVHDIFTSVGATNVSWVWCPYMDSEPTFGSLSALYPGNAYVDWTCVDVYNRDRPWSSFDDLFKSTYSQVAAIAPTKPMLLAEVATTSHGGSKASWITGLLDDLSGRYPLVRGVTWYETYHSGFDWPIETSKSAITAFAQAIASPLYAGSTFASLPSGPIAPP